MRTILVLLLLSACSQQETSVAIPNPASAASSAASAPASAPIHHVYYAPTPVKPYKYGCGVYSDFDYRRDRCH